MHSRDGGATRSENTKRVGYSMRAFLENLGLIVMVSIAVATLVRFPARRYLLVLITGIAIGAWLMGYALGARSAAETVYPFVGPDHVQQAKALVEEKLLSPLGGLAVGLFIVLLSYLAFGSDVRKNLRKFGPPPTRSNVETAGDHSGVIAPGPSQKSPPAYQTKPLQTSNRA